MPSGGARNRSGPLKDPNSGRSDRAGFRLDSLPNEGYKGKPPAFPLPAFIPTVPQDVEQLGEQLGLTGGELQSKAAKVFRARELRVWREAWTSPQAAVWARESWRWPVVAEYCRLKVTIEQDPGANAALVGQLHRYRDQLGLTPAGMRFNGWKIAEPDIEPADDQVVQGQDAGPSGGAQRQRRLRDVSA